MRVAMKRALFTTISVISMALCCFDGPQAFAADTGNEPSDSFSFEKGLTRGSRGRKGRKGKHGKRGKRGCRGFIGRIGPTGPHGPQGPIGIQGPVGPVGPVGPAGSQGPTGAQGPAGDTGPMGPVGPAGEAGPIVDESHTYALEEFVSGGINSGTFGALGWSATDEAGITYIPAEQDHPGILRMHPTATGLSSLFLSSSFVTDPADDFELRFIVRPGTLVGLTSFRVGLGDYLPNAPISGIYFEKNLASINWQIITIDGPTVSTIDSGILFNPTSWYNLKIKRNGTGLSFSINGIPFDPLNNDIPSAPLNVFAQADLSALGFSADIDYMSIQWPTLSR